MHVPLRQLQYWSSASQQWITASGSRTVYVGDADSLAGLPLQARVTIPSAGTITCDNSSSAPSWCRATSSCRRVPGAT